MGAVAAAEAVFTHEQCTGEANLRGNPADFYSLLLLPTAFF